MTIRRTLLLLFCATITGCMSEPQPQIPRYSGPGTQADFMNVRYQCAKETPNVSIGSGSIGQYGGGYSNATAPSCGALTSCLAAKGYMLDPNGPFAPPPGGTINCIN